MNLKVFYNNIISWPKKTSNVADHEDQDQGIIFFPYLLMPDIYTAPLSLDIPSFCSLSLFCPAFVNLQKTQNKVICDVLITIQKTILWEIHVHVRSKRKFMGTPRLLLVNNWCSVVRFTVPEFIWWREW